MEFNSWKAPDSYTRHFHIILTDEDIHKAYPILYKRYMTEMDFFNRPDATIEEQLMGLQLFARVLQELENEEGEA